ncbi:hypothetical protein KI387_027118, partial [Taxus chinensis]
MILFKTSGKDSVTSETLLKKILNLTNKDIIGTGGFGTVYKLVLDEHTAFAIKKLTRGSIDQERGFERELDAMGDIKHRNVVTLRGYYSTSHVNLLIFDLMKNGSLDIILHKSAPNNVPLDWPTRHKIALGAARGIAYLHHDCIPRIIHRDIKSSNILLDEDMDARIADFGLATLINPQQSHVSTLVAGTFGYLAPGTVYKCALLSWLILSVIFAEYVDTGRATEKGDVYSYGVVLFELLTGKRPTDEAFVEKGNNMVAWVKWVSLFGFFMQKTCIHTNYHPIIKRQESNSSTTVGKSSRKSILKLLIHLPKARPREPDSSQPMYVIFTSVHVMDERTSNLLIIARDHWNQAGWNSCWTQVGHLQYLVYPCSLQCQFHFMLFGLSGPPVVESCARSTFHVRVSSCTCGQQLS